MTKSDREDFPFGGETTLTVGLNAVLDAIEGKEPYFPFGNETVLTSGINAIIARIGGGGLGTDETSLTEQDKKDIATLVRDGMQNGDLERW